MDNHLTRKYNLITAICMVVGIVIGSGIFYKSTSIIAQGGSVIEGILAFFIVGLMMMAFTTCFSTLARKYEKVNGIIDYAEVTLGKKVGNYVGWFLGILYYPALTCVLAWLSSLYTVQLFEIQNEQMIWVIAIVYLGCSYLINSLAPIFAGKLQVTTTVIKLVPLIAMAIFGTIYGFTHGNINDNFSIAINLGVRSKVVLSSIVAVAFAYDGWIVATSINSEIKNSKRNLPLALLIGSFIVVIIYILYFFGLSGTAPFGDLSSNSDVNASFTTVFGKLGTLLEVFIIISCLGTLNGLTIGSCRGIYSIAVRDVGIFTKFCSKTTKNSKMPLGSCLVSFLLSFAWLFYWKAFLSGVPFFVDVSELPIVFIYAIYIAIFVKIIVQEKEFSKFNRYVLPILSILSGLVMVASAIIAHRMNVLWYLIQFLFAMLVLVVITIVKKHKKLN